MGKIILSLAMSLDGYICDTNGGFEFIHGDGNNSLDTDEKFDYKEFIKTLDYIVMGKTCYNQNLHKDYTNQKILVATNEKLSNYDNIEFISGDILHIVKEKTKNSEKDTFLFGGGVTIKPFIENNEIDTYIIAILPTILGAGKKLFLGNHVEHRLELKKYISDEGIVILTYNKKTS